MDTRAARRHRCGSVVVTILLAACGAPEPATIPVDAPPPARSRSPSDPLAEPPPSPSSAPVPPEQRIPRAAACMEPCLATGKACLAEAERGGRTDAATACNAALKGCVEACLSR